MKCPRCGHENRPHAKFCEECAAALGRRCTNCGSELSFSAKFCPECAHPARVEAERLHRSAESYMPKHLVEKILISRAALEGERKQVTVLFADLKGSMELLADRDAEEARELLDAVLVRMIDAVHAYEGTVNQVMGDGIMALFGAPVAHEDHGVRACYAALRMQATIRTYAEEMQRVAGIPIQIRIGLNSGEVLVRSVGSDLRMEYTAVGQTTHLAARMEQAAMPGSILLSAQTFRLVEDYIDVKPLGLINIKGLTEPVEVFEATGTGAVRTRLQRSVARGLTRFVGRDPELEQLRQALEQMAVSRGQIVAVVGEPGVGKSRLFYEFLNSHRMRGWLILHGSSVSYGRASAYLPVLDMLKTYFRIDDRDDVRAIRAKVTGGVLTLDETLKDVVPALLGLLAALPEDSPFARQSPPQRRQATLDALKRLIVRETQAQPVLLVFEDLHWIDSETQALLDALVESLHTTRMLIAVNYRPEYRHGWSHKTFYRQLPIEPLTAAGAEQLLRPLIGDHPSLQSLIETLIARTDRNPLFLEESVRTLIETRVLVGEAGRLRLAKPDATIVVPASVQVILAGRIDRLGPADKHLLQAASVVGKDVPLPLLATLVGEPEDALREALTRLQVSEFLYEASLFPDLEYTFKHALTHEVTYGGMLLERRRTLHGKMVDAIEARFADRLAEQADRLAHHAFRGEVWDKAASYSRHAGDRTAALCVDTEAVGHYQRALEALGHLPETPEGVRASIDVRLALRAPLWRGGQLERLRAIFEEVEALGTRHGATDRLDEVYSFLLQYYWAKGEYDRAIPYGARCIDSSKQQGTPRNAVTGHYYLGGCYQAQGQLETAVEHYEAVIEILSGTRETERFDMSGLPYSGAAAQTAHCLIEMGQLGRAEEMLREAERVANAVNHLYSKVPVAITRGLLLLQTGRASDVIRLLEPVVALCRDNNFAGQTMRALTALAQAYMSEGRPDDAVPIVQEAIALQEAAGAFVDRAYWVRILGEAYRRDGQLDEAETTARRALEFAGRHGERLQEAWVHALLDRKSTRLNSSHSSPSRMPSSA